MTTTKQSTNPTEGATGKQTPKPSDVAGRQSGGTAAASTPAPGGSKSGVLKDDAT